MKVTLEQCDQCDGTFNGDEWHPATFGPDSDRIYQFCSEACKQQFLDEQSPE